MVVFFRANHAYDILQEIEREEWTTIDGGITILINNLK